MLSLCYFIHIISTRLHSSRMRTARLLPVSPSMHCGGGSAPGWVCLLWGVCSWGCVPASGHGGCIPACNGADPPVNRMTDRCKNTTLPQTSFAGGNEAIPGKSIYYELKTFLTPKEQSALLLCRSQKAQISRFQDRDGIVTDESKMYVPWHLDVSVNSKTCTVMRNFM